MSRLRYLIALLGFAIALGLSSGPAEAKRVALVVGNSNYANVPRLPNPLNDADAIAASLQRLDFSVTLIKDVTKAEMELALGDFADASNGADISLLYFAGHGIEVGGENYLVPVDASLSSDSRVSFESVALDAALRATEGVANLRIVLLDACRDNPFLAKMKRRASTRSLTRGLAPVEPENSVIISYAASAGQVASDGDGSHSPYTQALLEHIEQPGLEIGFMFRKISAAVVKQTGGDQTPYEYARLPDKEIFLTPPSAGTDSAEAAAQNNGFGHKPTVGASTEEGAEVAALSEATLPEVSHRDLVEAAVRHHKVDLDPILRGIERCESSAVLDTLTTYLHKRFVQNIDDRAIGNEYGASFEQSVRDAELEEKDDYILVSLSLIGHYKRAPVNGLTFFLGKENGINGVAVTFGETSAAINRLFAREYAQAQKAAAEDTEGAGFSIDISSSDPAVLTCDWST